MKNKGFTLIELLAVIVIVSIIFVIVLPIVTNQIEEIKIKAYIQNENAVIKAAELYMHRNINSIPTNDYETFEVSIKELQEQKYLKAIKNPNNRKENCSGYVIVIKMESGNHEYIPHLKCGSKKEINNTTDDGLLLHYTFDDFQEPTENYINNIGFNEWFLNLETGNSTIKTVGGGLIEIKKLDQYKYVATVVEDVTYPILLLTPNFKWPPNIPITVSAIITDYYEASGTQGRLGIGRSNYGSPHLHGNEKLGHKEYTYLSDEERIGGIAIRSNDKLVKAGTFVEWEFLQMEYNKISSTPFVEGRREGIVVDYSGNENHGQIELETSPTWVSSGLFGKGAYFFNGFDNHISTSLKKTSPPFSLSLWAKRTEDFYVYASFANLLGWRVTTEIVQGIVLRSNYNISYHDYKGSSENYSSKVKMEKDKWYHIAICHDGDNIRIYIDGVLTREEQQELSQSSSNQLQVGAAKWTSGQNRAFKGYIDEVRVYNRLLSSDEIKLMYNYAKR